MNTAVQNPTTTTPLDFRRWSQRRASLISGIALAGMAVLMPLGYYGGIVPLITAGDAAKTATTIAAAPLPYWGGVVAIAIVILLDLIVSAAWYALFRSVSATVSAIAAWIRVIYTALFAVAAAQLVTAFLVLDDPARALDSLESFNTMWISSLGVFGIHLLVIGYLIVRATFISPVFGILLMIAGVGYILDAVGRIFALGFPVTFGSFAFVGEVAIIFWLLIMGRRLTN
jgi:hypothetical protein